jgi:hypothetical protein
MMKSIDEKVLDAYRSSVLNERKFDLGSGHKGNGITVWNRAKEVHGDYEQIAHIDKNRKIKYYIKNPPKEVKAYVEKIAKGSNPNVSTTQSSKVFKEDTELSEASQVTYDDVDPYVKEFVEKLFKNTTYKVDKQVIFDGIHGVIVNFMDQFNTPNIRVRKTDLKKIMSDKNVRWVDIAAIGL